MEGIQMIEPTIDIASIMSSTAVVISVFANKTCVDGKVLNEEESLTYMHSLGFFRSICKNMEECLEEDRSKNANNK